LHDYKTYSFTQPPDIYVKTACEDAGCEAHALGWQTIVAEATPLGAQQARYIRHSSGRTFREQRDGALTVFTFDSGQRCFAEHRTRPMTYRVTGAHWQAPRRPTIREHVRAADWVEDYAEHQLGLADQLAKG
jgi:hypothetical protein